MLDFWIDGLALLRYAEPTIISMQPVGRLQYADTDVVRIEVGMTGLEEGQTAELLLRLMRNSETVRQRSTIVRSGVQTVPLEVGENLDVGRYELQAQIAGSQRTVSFGRSAVLDGFVVTRSHGGMDDGGGMLNIAAYPTVANCVFQDNAVYGCGGAMYNGSASNPTKMVGTPGKNVGLYFLIISILNPSNYL